MTAVNPGRLRAKELISLLPGIHLRRLAKLLGVSLSTAHYHMRKLEMDREIVCRKEGEFLRAYPVSLSDPRQMELYSLLQRKAAREVLKVLISGGRGGLTNGELSAATCLSPSTVSEWTTRLRSLGLLSKVPVGDGRWELVIQRGDSLKLTAMIADFEKNFFRLTTENYLRLWDF
jgi:predicted transcriptional regulator